MPLPGVYEQPRVRTLINAAGDLTKLGGSLMEPAVAPTTAGAAA